MTLLSPRSGGPANARLALRLQAKLWTKLWVTWAAMVWERLWRRLWVAATLIGAWIILALIDVLPGLPGALHLLMLAAFAGGLAYSVVTAVRDFAWPSRQEARARLEQASPVVHRPLTAVEDKIAVGATPLQHALWRQHQMRARAQLQRLRSAWPSPGVAGRDHYAVRAAVVLLLIVAVIGAGSDIRSRLVRSLSPSFADTTTAVTVKLWITPPAYTNRSPIYVEVPTTDTQTKPLEVAADSKVLAVVTGVRRDLDLVLSGVGQPVRLPFEALSTEATSRRLEAPLTPAKRMELRERGHLLAGWDVTWVPDMPPTVAFDGAPGDGGRGRLRIAYKAHDDYGLKAVTAHITRPGDDSGAALDLAVSLPPFNPKDVTHISFHDVGAHPWAGLPVMIQLTATDQSGQSGTSDDVMATLPERTFNHPVARELVQRRKQLAANPDDAATPVRDAIARILDHPESFGGDDLVYLSLADAKYRLTYQTPADAAASLSDLLWETAVRIEDGDLAVAEKRLDDAERALQSAMEQNAPSSEVSRLLDELQRAVADYTKALSQQMPDNQQLAKAEQNGQMPEDLAQAMEQLRQLSQMGSQEGAKQMLSNIENMLQSLRNAAGGTEENPDVKSAEDTLKQLRDLTEQQSKLLDDSFERGRQAPPPQSQNQNQGQGQGKPQPQGSEQAQTAQAAEKQEQLRKQLGELMSRMSEMTGQIPQEMGQAEGAMRAAREALQSGSWKSGANAQGQALSKLEASQQQAAQDMMQALEKKGLSGMMQMQGNNGQRRFDGLGPRNGDGDNVDVPNGPDMDSMAQRVRAILEEIRRRASDRTRPEAEQEYLRRLMKQF